MPEAGNAPRQEKADECDEECKEDFASNVKIKVFLKASKPERWIDSLGFSPLAYYATETEAKPLV